MNANSVPILVISPTMVIGRKPAKELTNTANSAFDFHGVRKRG